MFEVREKISGKRRCMTGSVNVAFSFFERLSARGVKCTLVCHPC